VLKQSEALGSKFEIARKLSKEIESIKTEVSKQLEQLANSPTVMKHALKISGVISDIQEMNFNAQMVLQIAEKAKVNEREFTLMKSIAFLYSFEGAYTSCIDLLCYILIANDHDLHNYFQRKYVITIDDIENVDFSTKVGFLKFRHLSVVNRDEDRILRNKIAHQDFLINETGELLVEGKKVDIANRLITLLDFITALLIASAEAMKYLNEYLKKQMSEKNTVIDKIYAPMIEELREKLARLTLEKEKPADSKSSTTSKGSA
jgi:hypothetical protein